ncbi:MAG: hypothetical protein GY822_01700 [Deltaproteobacteria bacterium]|nr:hypothetical protein [Deltaproteobacteria bacterium]
MLLTLAPVFLGACNDHVFREVNNICSPTATPKEEQAEDIPADILLVVDNSGSMCEEQENLVRNFFRDECPITDWANIPVEYKNPTPETVAVLSQSCGFIQILATYDNDFRIGVVSTDATLCDNRLDTAFSTNEMSPHFCGVNPEPWGRRPQRGCLQADPAAEKKFIQNGDPDIQATFAAMINRVQTHGSPFERGLDAMRILLDDEADKHPDCQNDGSDFLREDARLVVIIISDEDDCSHSDGAGFLDENASETTCEESQPPWQLAPPNPLPSNCYDSSQREKLTAVSEYVDFLNTLKGPDKVSVAVIAGSTSAENGVLISAGCKVGDEASGNPGSPDGNCRPPGGQSNFTQNVGDICHPDHEGEVCCDADPGTRYYAFADPWTMRSKTAFARKASARP